MLTKNIVKQPKATVEVQIQVPWADLQTKWNETISKTSQELELPGFRKGQAPLEMVEQQYLSQIQQEFLKTSMPQLLIEALQGTNVVPIDYPQYQLISFTKGQELKFNARVTERPAISVGNYKAVKVARPALKQITDADVDKVIGDLYNRWKVRNPQQAQPTATAQTPEAQVPDDVFAQAVGATSLADLKTKIKQDLEAEAKYNNELDYEEAILQEVEKITTVDIPDILIQDELNRMLVSLQRSVTERGLLLDEYLKSQNKTADQIKEEWKPQAEKNVRMKLGLSEVARQEGVNIADEELQAEIDKIQDQKVKAQFQSQEPRMHLRHALRQTKTLNLLKTLVGA